jgi:hypothetical protein
LTGGMPEGNDRRDQPFGSDAGSQQVTIGRGGEQATETTDDWFMGRHIGL